MRVVGWAAIANAQYHIRTGIAAIALAGAAGIIWPVLAADSSGPTDWPSYNRTLTSERYVPFDQINRGNVSGLKQLCVYDLGIDTSFQTGPLVIGRTLYGTTEMDTFAIDADTCQPKWRVHENIQRRVAGQSRCGLARRQIVPRHAGRTGFRL